MTTVDTNSTPFDEGSDPSPPSPPQPPSSTPTSPSAAAAAALVTDEVSHIVVDITRIGTPGVPHCQFGELFDDPEVEQRYEALVGTLNSAKKRGLITFKGQMLLKGMHDNVRIEVVNPPEEDEADKDGADDEETEKTAEGDSDGDAPFDEPPSFEVEEVEEEVAAAAPSSQEGPEAEAAAGEAAEGALGVSSDEAAADDAEDEAGAPEDEAAAAAPDDEPPLVEEASDEDDAAKAKAEDGEEATAADESAGPDAQEEGDEAPASANDGKDDAVKPDAADDADGPEASEEAPETNGEPEVEKTEAAPAEGSETKDRGGDDENGDNEMEEAPMSAKERAKWLQEKAFAETEEANRRRAEEMKKRNMDAGVSVQERAKWMQEEAAREAEADAERKAEEQRKKSFMELGKGGGAKERAKWLQEQAFADTETKRRAEEMKKKNMDAGVSAQERARWLQEEAAREAEEEAERKAEEGRKKSFMEIGKSGGGAKERAKWLQEQAFQDAEAENKRRAEEMKKKNMDAGVSAQERAKWLQEEAAREAEEETKRKAEELGKKNTVEIGAGGGGGAKERAKWLQEQAFKDAEEENRKRAEEMRKKNMGGAEGISPTKSAKDRAKWLQESAFKDAEEETKKRAEAMRTKVTEIGDGGGSDGGTPSAKDRAKWLQESAFNKEEEKKKEAESPPRNSDLVADRMKWLQNGAGAAAASSAPTETPSKVDAAAEIGAGTTKERAEWLRQQSEGSKSDDSEAGAAGEEVKSPIPAKKSLLVTEKMKWLQEEAGKEMETPQKKVYSPSELRASGGSSLKEKAKWLEEEAALRPGSIKKGDAEVSAAAAEVSHDAVAARAKWIQEQGKEVVTSKGVEIESSSNVSDRMKWLSSKVDTYQKGVTRESDVVQAKSGKMKFVVEIASNVKDAPQKFKAVPHEAKIEDVEETVRDGLVPAVKSNFENGNLFVVRDVCKLMKELIPFRFIRKHPEPVAELADALLELDPPAEVLEKAGTTREEVLAETVLAVAPLLAIVGREDENLPMIAPRYMKLVDLNIAQASLWKEVTDMANRDPKSVAEGNAVACRAVEERDDVPQWEEALAVLDRTARYNVEPVEEISYVLLGLCTSYKVKLTDVAGIMTAYAEVHPETLEPFLDDCGSELGTDEGCDAMMPLLAKASGCEAIRQKLLPVVDAIEGDPQKFGSTSYIADSSTIVKEVSGERNPQRCLEILAALATVQKDAEESMSNTPLSHFKDVYQSEEVPRDVIDADIRPKIESLRDECPDEATKETANEILDYRDDSSVVVEQLKEGEEQPPSAEDVKAGLSTLLGFARSQIAREGGSPATPLSHFREVCTIDGVSYDVVDQSMKSEIQKMASGDECQDEAAHSVAKDILKYLDESELRDVRDYVREHSKETKVYIGRVASKLPMPVMFKSKPALDDDGGSDTGRKMMSLYFECCEKADGGGSCLYPGRAPKKAFVSETTEINKWLQVAVSAVLVDVAAAAEDLDDLTGVGAVKKAWDSARDTDSNGDGGTTTFKDFVSQSFLNDDEQEILVQQLREIKFYDQFNYWAPKGGWRCKVCYQKEQLEKKRKMEEAAAAKAEAEEKAAAAARAAAEEKAEAEARARARARSASPPSSPLAAPQSAPSPPSSPTSPASQISPAQSQEADTKDPSGEGVLIMGMIERRGTGALSKKWKKQLVKVLFSDSARKIVYDDPQNPKKHGMIELKDVSAVKKERRDAFKGHEYVFSVATTRKTYHFATRHVNDLDTWVSVINGCIERINRG